MDTELKLGKSLDDLIKEQKNVQKKQRKPAANKPGTKGALGKKEGKQQQPHKPGKQPQQKRVTPNKGAGALKSTKGGGVQKAPKVLVVPRSDGKPEQGRPRGVKMDVTRKVPVTARGGRGSGAGPMAVDNRSGGRGPGRGGFVSRPGGGGGRMIGSSSGKLSDRFDSLPRMPLAQPLVAAAQSRPPPTGYPGPRRNVHGVVMPF